MLIVHMYELVRLVVDDFTGDVNKQDVMSLSDVKDRIAGTIGEFSHADVQAVVTALDVIDGKLGE